MSSIADARATPRCSVSGMHLLHPLRLLLSQSTNRGTDLDLDGDSHLRETDMVLSTKLHVRHH